MSQATSSNTTPNDWLLVNLAAEYRAVADASCNGDLNAAARADGLLAAILTAKAESLEGAAIQVAALGRIAWRDSDDDARMRQRATRSIFNALTAAGAGGEALGDGVWPD